MPGTPTILDSKRSNLSIFYTQTLTSVREEMLLPGALTGLNNNSRNNLLKKKKKLMVLINMKLINY